MSRVAQQVEKKLGTSTRGEDASDPRALPCPETRNGDGRGDLNLA